MYKTLTDASMMGADISVKDIKCFLKVKPKLTNGQRNVCFSDAVKAAGMDCYKQTHCQIFHQLMHLNNAHNKEKRRVPLKDSGIEDD